MPRVNAALRRAWRSEFALMRHLRSGGRERVDRDEPDLERREEKRKERKDHKRRIRTFALCVLCVLCVAPNLALHAGCFIGTTLDLRAPDLRDSDLRDSEPLYFASSFPTRLLRYSLNLPPS